LVVSSFVSVVQFTTRLNLPLTGSRFVRVLEVEIVIGRLLQWRVTATSFRTRDVFFNGNERSRFGST